MRDLDIWRRLIARTASAGDLRALGELDLERRVAFLGHVAPLVTHAEPAMRAAAVRLLAGARGVQGVRAIVPALDDADEHVRSAAVAALRDVARDAPYRYVHALFHPRSDIRRAALDGELTIRIGELAVYLHGDPDRPDLANKARWPADSLGLALDFYRNGELAATELIRLFTQADPDVLRTYLRFAHGRPLTAVEDYLDGALRHRDVEPRGYDVFDDIVRALAETGTRHALEQFVGVVTVKDRKLARRAVVALLAHVARTSNGELWGACVAIEPRVLGSPHFDATHAPAVSRALFHYRWPHRPPVSEVERVLTLAPVRTDLALAAAIVGLLPGKRLERLEKVWGEDAIVAALVASDNGWDEICRLPPETPPRELAWLRQVEKIDYKRYVALAGRALGGYDGKRLDAFVEQMPRRHRPAVFLAALAAHSSGPDERVASVGKAIAARVDRTTLSAVFDHLLRTSQHDRMVIAIARAAAAKLLASAAAELDDAAVVHLLALLDTDPISRDRELALANALVERTDPAIVDWRRRIEALVTAPVAIAAPLPRVHRALTSAERSNIATCSERQLETAIEPVFAGHISGLCGALAERAPVESVIACNALLGCADPLHDVARLLDQFAGASPKFHVDLDNAAVRWVRIRELPVLAHARLWRWEAHTFAMLGWIESVGGSCNALRIIEALPGRLARDTLWKALCEALMLIRYRDVARFKTHATEELALYCAARIDADIGRHAARTIVALVESRLIPLGLVRERVLDRAADADAETRQSIARLIRLDGLPEPPPSIELPPMRVIEQIRATRDVDVLARWCRDPRQAIVQEAALALVVLVEAGQARLASMLSELDEIASPIPLLATVQLWDDPNAVAAARVLAASPALPPAWQFHLALNLCARGDADALPRALEAVRAKPAGWYFRREDWDALVRVADIVTCSLALADSPHHHAYQRAVRTLTSLTRPDERVREALRRFLDTDATRPLHLRVDSARYLATHWQDPHGLAIMIEYIADERATDWMYTLQLVPRDALPVVGHAIVDAALIGGPRVCSEKRMWSIVQRMRDDALIDAVALAELDVKVFEGAATAAARRAAAKYAVASATAHARLRRVAEVFAWGIRRGVELTGRLFRIHMTAKEKQLGHTKLDGSHIFVSPLPMLRAEPHGQDVVEGLILHELGHHIYHRGEQAQALWNRAHSEGIGHFLNLIADEHLERNLRAQDPAYGDRLKRLGAYAFHHAPQEIKVPVLLDALGASAARAFINAELGVAYDEEAVRVRRGAILGELDHLGHPVARFSRALRMGLGNRHGDPLIERALALCGKELRTLDMQGLYDLTWKLVELFGGKHQIAKVFGGPEGLVFGDRDDDVFGAGVDDDILQREVERVLDPRRSKRGPGGTPERLQLNVNPDTRFDRITRVVRVRGDAEQHRKLAAEVQRHSTRLRAYLDELGLRWEQQRARTQGRALDRTRLVPLVTRNDPRILVARNPVRRTDLFLGTLVDCSASMTAGQNIERAKKFAILVAEAVRALPGVEARFFGFTDSIIYDAGDANDCGAVALTASGGNNDAAGLYHAANVALASPRRAKVLVMISDGLPSDCSVAALKALVMQLTKRRAIVCAQVAVRRLEEVCFPHHVLLDDNEPDIAVAKFGRMIGELARRSLAS